MAFENQFENIDVFEIVQFENVDVFEIQLYKRLLSLACFLGSLQQPSPDQLDTFDSLRNQCIYLQPFLQEQLYDGVTYNPTCGFFEVDLSKDVLNDNGTYKPLKRGRNAKKWFLLASTAANVYDRAYRIHKNFPKEENYKCAREIEIKALGWTSPEMRSGFFRTH